MVVRWGSLFQQRGKLRSSLAVTRRGTTVPYETHLKGINVLHDPLTNKGMGHEMFERDRLHLRGLVPPRFKALEEQVQRALRKIRGEESDARKNLYLQELQDRNETLYLKVLHDYIEEMAPLVYTPTVGVVCEQFGTDFRRPRGMYFSSQDRGQFAAMCYNWPIDDVKVIVVTDGSRILGLGDLGVHGMGISIGKLALYCAAGGIAPSQVLPVVLDVGTNNDDLRNSPDYVGTPSPRLDDPEYYEFVDEFMRAVVHRWPKVVIQFEDFETKRAVPLLEKYRNEYRCFNDDIQGTGCVTLAGVLSAARIAQTYIKDMRFVCVGAGSAGLGVCDQLVDGMVHAGLTREEAKSRFVVCTSKGALGKEDGRFGDPNFKRGLSTQKAGWVNDAVSDGASLLEAVRTFKPTCLLGLAAQGGIFTEDVVKAMTEFNSTPIIMPMSNPTSKAECTPQQAYEWTQGTAIVATGSPFPPVEINGQSFTPSQCNNMYVFPGIGLAASIAGTTKITDRMLYKAAVACVDSMLPEEIEQGRTFPNITRIRDVSLSVACAVIEEGFEQNLNLLDPSLFASSSSSSSSSSNGDDPKQALRAYVKARMWQPAYQPIVNPLA